MGRNNKVWRMIITVLLLLILTQHVMGQGNNVYTCWGGCYNKCFLLGGNSPGNQYPCYFRCVSSCSYAQSAGNFQFYCQIGCSATRCVPLGSDGARLENCLGACNNACNV